MDPCHVREFDSSQLEALWVHCLSPVEVIGLVAKESLDSIEARRLGRAREKEDTGQLVYSLSILTAIRRKRAASSPCSRTIEAALDVSFPDFPQVVQIPC